jgi:type I restriction enzyme S subunit
MEEWKEYKLKDVATLTTGFPFDGHKYAKEGIRVVRGDNVTIGNLRWDSDKDKRWAEPFERSTEYTLHAEDIVIGMDGSRVGKNRAQVKKEDLPLLIAQRVACVRHNELSLQKYLYYQIFSDSFEQYIKAVQTGTSIPHVSLKQIGDFPIVLPSISKQKRIAEILSSLDKKIEINRRINDNFYFAFLEVILIWLLTSHRNDNLEQQAQALFKSWFVDFEPFKNDEFKETELGLIPKGWEVVSLSTIADYINGLAMQKYRPIEGEKGLPVLKIKELGQGNTDDSSELCSPSLIGEKYIIDDGDIIFSWSGTLMVKVWCGGKCGLNQHLFVVEPKDYPHWFAYQWTKHHLDNFIHIAKDKAVTMGHIKRGELDKAKVVVPVGTSMAAIDSMMKPLHSQIISNRIESRLLAELRDTLLPRLMLGELKVNDLNTIK